jgi:hypothetical protein
MREKLITTLKEYKETYSSRLENHVSKYEDYDELHFINNELYVYQNCLVPQMLVKVEYNRDFGEGHRVII